jgi:membrane-associated protease RseP (regulator of RpoE activity)
MDPPGVPPRLSGPRYEDDLRDFRKSLLGRPPPPLTLRSLWRNILLFVLTALSVYLSGGPLMAVALLSILTAHEMGHYLMCRRHGVDATLPFFIPFPFPWPWDRPFIGTLGAFIRMRSPIPDRRSLMDIGVMGPLAGFVVCLPVLVFGVLEARIVPHVASPDALSLGEPLLFQWATWLLKGPVPEGMDVLIGPVGRAAWFGLFVTSLNLMPIGQLDGGHVAYALLRRHHQLVSRVALAACVVLLYLRPTWLLWTILLLVLGRRHPPTLDDARPLDPGRVALGILGFAVFAVCFTPNPFLISWREFIEAWQALFGLIFTSR